MFRIYFEMKYQKYPGYFITLTYDEKHVRRIGKRLSLRFRDVQLFLKRVRKHKHYAKYICVGEYGGQTKRPHYHMLLWTDCPPERLEQFWQQGSIHFGTLSIASAMYTLKYIIQPKQKVEKDLDGRVMIEKTRAQFSKGLGLDYLTTAVYDWHTENYDRPVMWSVVDGNKVALPRYYKNKIFTKHQMQEEACKNYYKAMKEKRKLIRDLRKRGLPGRKLEEYLYSLRVEEANRILKNTKFNQTL